MTKIYSLSIYQPYHGGQNPDFDKSSGMLLDFKKGESKAVNYWYPQISRLIRSLAGETPFSIATVPSSTKGKKHPGFTDLINRLGREFPILNENRNLIGRTESIDKLASGGNRDIGVHLRTLEVPTSANEYKPVILLDDVTTSGNSIKAAISKLEDAGYTVIAAIALGKTAEKTHA
ncbi:TPA: phosphoribosyltransferase [Morganella morganii]|nr:phosphoribosyltransferase [Morganella morganii]